MYTGSPFITVEFFGTLSIAATPWGLLASPAPAAARSITLAELASTLRLYFNNKFHAAETALYRADYAAAHRGDTRNTPGLWAYNRDWPEGCLLL